MDYYERIYTTHGKPMEPITGKYIIETKIYNMETKKKINWLKIWQMIRDILVGILTADAIRDKI